MKMLTHVWLKASLGPSFNLYLLAVVLLILAAGVIASIVTRRRDARRQAVGNPYGVG